MSAVGVHCRELFKVHRTARGDAAALQGLTLDAAPGEMLALLGPSGSGKSTLLAILAGLERPSAGTASRGRRGYRAARIAASSRGPPAATSSAWSASMRSGRCRRRCPSPRRSHCPCACAAQGQARPAGPRRAARARRPGRPRRRRGPHELSGGERQRVAYAPPSRTARRSCSPTSRPASSTPPRRGTCWACSASCRVRGRVSSRHPRPRRRPQRRPRGAHPRRPRELENHDEVVVGRGGWLARARAPARPGGIGGRAHVHVEDAGVVLRPVAAPPTAPGGRTSR